MWTKSKNNLISDRLLVPPNHNKILNKVKILIVAIIILPATIQTRHQSSPILHSSLSAPNSRTLHTVVHGNRSDSDSSKQSIPYSIDARWCEQNADTLHLEERKKHTTILVKASIHSYVKSSWILLTSECTHQFEQRILLHPPFSAFTFYLTFWTMHLSFSPRLSGGWEASAWWKRQDIKLINDCSRMIRHIWPLTQLTTWTNLINHLSMLLTLWSIGEEIAVTYNEWRMMIKASGVDERGS